MEEKKITLMDGDEAVEFFVVDETKLGGVSYLLVTDTEDDDEDGECYILKDLSAEGDSEAVYEFVEDEDEMEGVFRIFMELLGDDVDLQN